MATILIIEDEATIRSNLQRFLILLGHHAIEADNGLTGLELARQHRPDLILCDVMMPKLDGFGVVRALRDDPSVSATPFVFLTASVERDDQRFGIELGADDYVTKPFNLGELAQAIARRLPPAASEPV